MVPIDNEDVQAELFSLDGLGEFGPIAGASWGQGGLHLVSSSGHLLHCEGHTHRGGRWPCRAAEHVPLPLAKGAELLAAAISHPQGGAGPLVAIVLRSFPQLAAVYRSVDGAWQPEHEVHLPPHGGRPGLSLDHDELLVTLPGGEVHRRPVVHGARGGTLHAAVQMTDGSQREFCSSCAMAQGKLLRLALRQGQANAWAPEIVASA
eukprot:SRR837773.4987.p2 GENE.SRR837773.4987~~SRR837773.4987.p2  ORF type:complete len:206 (-),score=46.62 SRR837773.4987:55-672(-)